MKKQGKIYYILGALFLISILLFYLVEVVKTTLFDKPIVEQTEQSVSISGNYSVVGTLSQFNDNQEIIASSVMIYACDANDNWNYTQKLLPINRSINDRFGYAVSISGNYAIIGSPFYNIESINDGGIVYIYECNSEGVWEEVFKGKNNNALYYGYEVYAVGDYVFISFLNKETYKGMVDIYKRNSIKEWNHWFSFSFRTVNTKNNVFIANKN